MSDLLEESNLTYQPLVRQVDDPQLIFQKLKNKWTTKRAKRKTILKESDRATLLSEAPALVAKFIRPASKPAPTTTLVSISVTPAGAAVHSGKHCRFVATGTFNDGKTKDLSDVVKWTSNNTSNAICCGGGVVQALRPGGAAITAELLGVSDVGAVAVTEDKRKQRVKQAPEKVAQSKHTEHKLGRPSMEARMEAITKRLQDKKQII